MSGAQRSVGRFCSVVTNDLTSLPLLDATILGNGAQAYVASTGRSYRFFTGSGLTTMSPVVVRDTLNTGAWIQENAVNDQTFFIESTTTSGFSVCPQNTWRALPLGNTYSAFTPKACWSVSNSGVVTYNGPTATFQVIANFGATGTTLAQDTWEFDITRNGVAISTTTSFVTSTTTTQDQLGNIYCGHLSTPLTITPAGTTYQHIIRQTTTSSSSRPFSLHQYQACFLLIPG